MPSKEKHFNITIWFKLPLARIRKLTNILKFSYTL
jgi:hypothetical protein